MHFRSTFLKKAPSLKLERDLGGLRRKLDPDCVLSTKASWGSFSNSQNKFADVARLLVWFQDTVSVKPPPRKKKKTQALAFETIFSRILPILSNTEGLGDEWGAVRATDRIITDWKIPGNYKVERTRLRSINFIIKSPRKGFCAAQSSLKNKSEMHQ